MLVHQSVSMCIYMYIHTYIYIHIYGGVLKYGYPFLWDFPLETIQRNRGTLGVPPLPDRDGNFQGDLGQRPCNRRKHGQTSMFQFGLTCDGSKMSDAPCNPTINTHIIDGPSGFIWFHKFHLLHPWFLVFFHRNLQNPKMEQVNCHRQMVKTGG